MWIYEKKLEFPVKIKQTNPGLAKLIITQYGGPYCCLVYLWTMLFLFYSGSQ